MGAGRLQRRARQRVPRLAPRAREDTDAPWLYSVNPIDPHHPWDPPAEYREKYENRPEELPTPTYEPGELDDKPAVQRRNSAEGDFAAMDDLGRARPAVSPLAR